MTEAARHLIVIPVYNHAATLRSVAERAMAFGPLLVVDDGSSDGGADVLDGLGVEVIRHPVNQGKGAAILTAAARAEELGFTHIVTLDADDQHDPADIPKFLQALAEEPMSIVVGARDFNTANVPGSSRFGREFSNFWLRVQTGQRLSDTQSGFRAYPVNVLRRLKFSETHYSFEVEVLVRAVWAGLSLRDVAISVHYPPAEERVSHFRGFVDNLRLSLLNTRLTVRSMLPWPHDKLLQSGKTEKAVSLRHPVRSMRNLMEGRVTPMDIALSVALGIFLGTLPIMGLHSVAILAAASYLRQSKVVALAASQLCAPPLVPALAVEAGYFLRHGQFLTELSMQTLGTQFLDRAWEWVIGSVALAPLLALAMGFTAWSAAVSIRLQMKAVRRYVGK
jgi:uncharacterized protein (DUF2062 family)